MNRVALLVFVCVAGPVAAHDYWLQADNFFPKVGETVPVRLFVGDDFVVEAERPFQKSATVRFQLHVGKEMTDLVPLGEEEKTPLMRPVFRAAGTHLMAMERAPRLITLEAEKFNKYLAEEGLDAIVTERKKLGEDNKPGRERYSRCLKSLIQVGETTDETATRVLGQKVEIVPQTNPYSHKRGDKLSVRVLFDGKPLVGAKVFTHRKEGKDVTTQSARTSDDGQVSVMLDGSGVYLIRLVHMRRVRDAEADWESYWSALTFAVR